MKTAQSGISHLTGILDASRDECVATLGCWWDDRRCQDEERKKRKECCVDVFCYPTGFIGITPWAHCYIEVTECDASQHSYELNVGTNAAKITFIRLGGKIAKQSQILKDSQHTGKKRRSDAKRYAHFCFDCGDREEESPVPCACIEFESKSYPFRRLEDYGYPGHKKTQRKSARQVPGMLGPNSNTFVSYVTSWCRCDVNFPENALGHDFLEGGVAFDVWMGKGGKGAKAGFKHVGHRWWRPGDRVNV